MLALLNRLKGSSFNKDVAQLFTGTVIGRAVTMLSMPLLARLYSPGEYQMLSIYAAIVTTVAVSASLRLEIAIPLASTNEEAANLMASAVAIGFITSVLSTLICLFGSQVAGIPALVAFRPYIPLVGMGIFLAVLYSAFQYWATRHRRFVTIAKTRVTQSISSAIVAIAMGVLGGGALGLLLGNMMNRGAGNGRYIFEMFREDRAALREIRLRKMIDSVSKNRNYPLFSASEALINVAGLQVPMLLVSLYAGVTGGHLFLAMQISAIPMSLIGSSIAQVYLSRAEKECATGNLSLFTARTIGKLVAVGIGPLAFAGIALPLLIPFLFGQVWGEAGKMLPQLVPWMMLQFVASPVSMVMYVTERQRQLFFLTTFGAIIRIGAVSVAIWWGGLPLIASFAVTGAVFYAVCLAVFANAAGVTRRQVLEHIIPPLVWSMPFLVLGFALWLAFL